MKRIAWINNMRCNAGLAEVPMVSTTCCRALRRGFVVPLLLGLAAAVAARDAPPDDLGRLSLQDLGDVQVTSVSKVAEPLRNAPAAVYVITHDEIVRSGATSLPEVLRLAPNLLMAQLTTSSYTGAARGFGGNPDLQNFSNKLLMLIDGRSVYSPLYSGIYYDAQDVVLDD
ncbi:MAG: Plug domain-containing protein, partial [Pseudomonadota bacterium]